jgi:hypothetical protein
MLEFCKFDAFWNCYNVSNSTAYNSPAGVIVWQGTIG